MKQVIFSAVVGLTQAVDTATLAALMQQAPFSFQNSNQLPDSDIKRQFPNFANPADQNTPRPPAEEKSLPDDYVPKAVKAKQAAIKDPILAKQPKV